MFRLDKIGVSLEAELTGIIYKITNTVNNKVYIGQSVNSFRGRYRGNFSQCKNEHLKSSVKKYGSENFIVEILAKNQDVFGLNMLEAIFIEKYKSDNKKFGYNKQKGGYNATHSEETIRMIGEAKRGKTLSEETKRKLSEATKGENNPMYGVHRFGESSPRAKEVTCIIYGKEYTKGCKKDMVEFINEEFNIPCKNDWFKPSKGVPFEYQDAFQIKGREKRVKKPVNNSKQITVIINSVSYTEESKAKMVEFINNNFDIKCTKDWFKPAKGIPKIYQNIIQIVKENEDLKEVA